MGRTDIAAGPAGELSAGVRQSRSHSDRSAPQLFGEKSRFTVFWVASIVKWDKASTARIEDIVRQAMDLLPYQCGLLGGRCNCNRNTFCFAVFAEAATSTVARSLAIAGLREALSSAGVGLASVPVIWARLVLDLDPRAFSIRPFEPDDLDEPVPIP